MRAREGGYRMHTIHANTSRAHTRYMDHAQMHSSLHTCPMPELHTCIRAKRDSRSWHRNSTARLWPLASSFAATGASRPPGLYATAFSDADAACVHNHIAL
jgi:hypothetical protein